MVEPCDRGAECECEMSSDDANNASEESDAEEMGRGCREIKEKQYALERQDAEKLIADTKTNVVMDTDESFSDHELSTDASVAQSTDGAGLVPRTPKWISAQKKQVTQILERKTMKIL